MAEDDTYKYLGLLQPFRTKHKDIRARVTKKYYQRLDTLLNTDLNGKNLFEAINTFAVRVLTYTFSVERLTCVTLIKYWVDHQIQRWIGGDLPRAVSGRDMIDIGRLCDKQVRVIVPEMVSPVSCSGRRQWIHAIGFYSLR